LEGTVPVKSYLTYPKPGRLDEVVAALSALDGCEVFPSTTHDVLILLTDTPTDDAENALENALHQVPGIQCLALVSGAEPNLIQIDSSQEARA
jgi:nitrate reductase NapAB chaperone NapD